MKHKKKHNICHTKKTSIIIKGSVKRTEKGCGWLEDNTLKIKKVFLSANEIKGIFNGDIVLCYIEEKPQGIIGHIKKIIKRNTNKILGKIIKKNNVFFIKPNKILFDDYIRIKKECFSKIKNITTNNLVEAEIVEQPYLAKITRIIDESKVFSSKVEEIIINSGIKINFNNKIKKEISKFYKNPNESDKKNRLNLTKTALCTIDSEDAKDFDDAIFAEKIGDNFKVIVAIADVSHYVKENSNLDMEAYERGTSIYYPGNSIPMIPKFLSNGLCSLKPKVNRLCIAVEMIIESVGNIKNIKINNAIMESKARLNYKLVQMLIEKKNTSHIPYSVKKSINTLIDVSRILRKARQKRGALDFDTIENFIQLNNLGEPSYIYSEKRLEAHQLIEDLMITTNEIVANFIEKYKKITLYRIHEKPNEEKLNLFIKSIQAIGLLKIKKKYTIKSSKDLSIIMSQFNNHKSSYALMMLLLRSMSQAKYNTENIGHFGLASKRYLHFTSPIRRYPDLIVHRIIKSILSISKKTFLQNKKKMQDIATHCSNQERKAVNLERTLDAFYSTWFMNKKIGFTDKGTVITCTEFGIFVRLKTYPIEGLIHITKIKKGFLKYNSLHMKLENKQSGFSIGIGDIVKVCVTSVNINKNHIDLKLI